MIQSINFRVKKWDFNKTLKQEKLHTDTFFSANPMVHKQTNKTDGLCFIWTLIITANEIELLYYSSEECFVIIENELSDERLIAVIKASYDKSYSELAKRNLAVGLDAGFSPFHKIPYDLKAIRHSLES